MPRHEIDKKEIPKGHIGWIVYDMAKPWGFVMLPICLLLMFQIIWLLEMHWMPKVVCLWIVIIATMMTAIHKRLLREDLLPTYKVVSIFSSRFPHFAVYAACAAVAEAWISNLLQPLAYTYLAPLLMVFPAATFVFDVALPTYARRVIAQKKAEAAASKKKRSRKVK